jgi:hypothetical protein
VEQEQYEAMRRSLEEMAQQQLKQAADLSRLFTLMDTRILAAENTLRDMRLTMTGIGSLAKNLAERQQVHEDILKSLAATLAKQDIINENQQRTNERLEGILSAIRDLLGRGNGR